MNPTIAKERIEALTRQLNNYNKAYFQEAKSLVSDFEYDKLLASLEKLEKAFPMYRLADSPTQRVGEQSSTNFPTVKHLYRMRSLSNTYEEKEIKQFVQRIKNRLPDEKIDFLCEIKADGVALSLTYVNNRLTQIITRGDGTKGDDITINTPLLRNVPLVLKSDQVFKEVTIHGEAAMPKAMFKALNNSYEAAGKPLLANPRNATAGMLRTKKIAEALKKKQPLTFTPYRLCAVGDAVTATQKAALQRLQAWGFDVPPTYQYCKDIVAIMQYIHHWEQAKHHLPIMVDGIVIKLNNLALQAQIGATAKVPRGMIAYKYKPDQAATILKEVTYQVGRTGVVTPVAILAPVALAGTTVKRASLYNAKAIAMLDLQIGDRVFIEKGGDIIPKVTGVDQQQRKAGQKPIKFVTHCPACNSLLVQESEDALRYCPNTLSCPPQLKGRILHFVQRKALNITTIGNKTIDLFFEKGLLRQPADLFDLTATQIAPLEGFQKKSIDNLLQGIEAAKKTPFSHVLFGLGIRHVGFTIAEKLATHFGNIDDLMAASEETLCATPEVGAKIAHSLITYFKHPTYRAEIARLREVGLSFVQAKPTIADDLPLTGKVFVVSGVFKSYSREEIRDYIQKKGGKVVGQLSSNVDFLLTGTKPGPQKVTKAKALAIAIITEEALEKMTKKKKGLSSLLLGMHLI
ncbi:MAG: NAD-dependent DNA ligase LigA [Bacteroidota bacterium]